mmetsp:Transcript_69033/g.113191  ORF Transcript_69033/g.113191 Transcript_69033/m.113191 type:complete len:296 (+) Transcript_69033:48-935(+)
MPTLKFQVWDALTHLTSQELAAHSLVLGLGRRKGKPKGVLALPAAGVVGRRAQINLQRITSTLHPVLQVFIQFHPGQILALQLRPLHNHFFTQILHLDLVALQSLLEPCLPRQAHHLHNATSWDRRIGASEEDPLCQFKLLAATLAVVAHCIGILRAKVSGRLHLKELQGILREGIVELEFQAFDGLVDSGLFKVLGILLSIFFEHLAFFLELLHGHVELLLGSSKIGCNSLEFIWHLITRATPGAFVQPCLIKFIAQISCAKDLATLAQLHSIKTFLRHSSTMLQDGCTPNEAK